MGSLDIFVENINRLAAHYHLDTYADIAQFLNVTEDSIKRWQSKTRCPSLKTIDQIGDRIGCQSYTLIQKMEKFLRELILGKIIHEKYYYVTCKNILCERGGFLGMIRLLCFMALLAKML